jgi:hypothetical protein
MLVGRIVLDLLVGLVPVIVDTGLPSDRYSMMTTKLLSLGKLFELDSIVCRFTARLRSSLLFFLFRTHAAICSVEFGL